MRRLPLGVLLSVAVHAVAVALVGTRSFPPRDTSEAVTLTPIDIIAVDMRREAAAPAFDVALPDSRPAASAAPARPSQRPRERDAARGAVIVVPGPAPAEIAPRPSTPGPGLAMRHGEQPRLALPSGRWDDLDHVPRGTGPEKPHATGILHESGGGSLESDQSGFIARVNPDGSVKLTDKPSASIHFALPSPKDLGRALAQWYEAPKGTYGETTDMPMGKKIQLSTGPTTDPGDEAHPEHSLKDSAKTVIVPVFAGGAELTDWLMRRHGQDPYASKKLKVLDATRDERVEMGKRHRVQRLALTPQIVRRNLDALWAALPDPRARKQALFELWDECVETGEPAVVAGGEAARRLVIGFIRAHLPADGADAYTPAELEAFARARHSKAAFQPYE